MSVVLMKIAACLAAATMMPSASALPTTAPRQAPSLLASGVDASLAAPIVPAAGNNNFCATMGPKSPSSPTNVPTCEAFHSYPTPPIMLPEDMGSTAKYGVVRMSLSLEGGGPPNMFIDRAGAEYPIDNIDALLPADLLTSMRTIGTDYLLVFQAGFAAGATQQLNYLQPILYIPYTTVLSEFKGTTFVGQLRNLAPLPDSVSQTLPEYEPFTFTFGSQTVVSGPEKLDTSLLGRFETLFSNTLQGQTCQKAFCPALAALNAPVLTTQTASLLNAPAVDSFAPHPTPSTATAPSFTPIAPAAPTGIASTTADERCAFYQTFVGGSDDISIYWDPNMHFIDDSELVVRFSSGITYMARMFRVQELFQPNTEFFAQSYPFTIHGNPMGTAAVFEGTFSKTVAPVQKC